MWGPHQETSGAGILPAGGRDARPTLRRSFIQGEAETILFYFNELETDAVNTLA
jgi:hypothetical protein